MGFKLTWMATQEADEAAILDRLNVRIVGEAEGRYGGVCRTSDGWLIILSNHEVRFEKLAPEVVPEGSVLTGAMNEIVMVSEVRGFRDGAQEWAVVHDPDIDRHGVQAEGTPPEIFAEIYRRALEEQADGEQDVDYVFDVPVNLATRICGFTVYEEMDVTWRPLAKGAGLTARAQGKGFFARLFGR